MAKVMKRVAAITLLLMIFGFILYQITNNRILIPFVVTFGTTAYHFTIRLLVGMVVDRLMQNKADYCKKWYGVSDYEMKLYQKMKVKKWKNHMPTFHTDTFDACKHSWDEIAQATCQSEIVHEINIIFSMLPVASSLWFGAFWVFLITSVLAAGFDLMFVIIQRFNRKRILKIKRRS